ncbi:DUF3192 domain-containing protein [Victivallis sp. Marseille-Q1083]|uniref:DUF3192 domain-containing protein n=1 Tax=Victivallis sp. Marseille-Q1083 TaxID=2717288 RepID=UPI00158831ED|nr:DUF3192 domain-containing protein [Victivallis sp. Marseille-Q1083]
MTSKYLLLPALALLLSGCGYFSQYDNLKNAEKLRVGMTKQEVLGIMGEPLTNEVYNTPNVWYYYVTTQWHDGLYTEDECMPLLFEDGKLIGWGNEFYNRLRMQNKHVIKD